MVNVYQKEITGGSHPVSHSLRQFLASSMTVLTSPFLCIYILLTSSSLHRARPGGFSLELGYKDCTLVKEAAKEVNVPMPFLSVLLDRYTSSMAKDRSVTPPPPPPPSSSSSSSV